MISMQVRTNLKGHRRIAGANRFVHEAKAKPASGSSEVTDSAPTGEPAGSEASAHITTTRRPRLDWGQIGTFVTGIATAAAVVFTGITVSITRDQAHIAQEGQLTDRFTKAVEQLGGEKLEVRVGGIYALERIARDSPKDHAAVMDVLAAFLRSRPPVPKDPVDSGREALYQDRGAAVDIQAAVTAIARRDTRRDSTKINLSGAQLAYADLTRANLAKADLRGADLTEANLADANFTDADLVGANLSNASLFAWPSTALELPEIKLQGANLATANLSNVDLSGIDLRETTLVKANLTGTELTNADWAGWTLFGLNLTHANMNGINLQGSHLEKVDLTNADLTNANLGGATLKDSTLTGSRLAGANLDQADLTGVTGGPAE